MLDGSPTREATAEPAPPCAPQELPRLAFIHIPKTAGTSITNLLWPAYGKLMFPGMTTLDYCEFSDAALAAYRFFKGHAYRRDYSRLPADTRRFTVLRDPVARAISCYKYYRQLPPQDGGDAYVAEAVQLAQTSGVVEFIYSSSPFLIEHMRLGQIRQFMTDATLKQVAHRQFLTVALKRQIVAEFAAELATLQGVLTCELLPLSLPPLLRDLGVPLPAADLPRDNVSPGGDVGCLLDIRRAVMDVNETEFLCYDIVRQRELDRLLQPAAAGPAR